MLIITIDDSEWSQGKTNKQLTRTETTLPQMLEEHQIRTVKGRVAGART